MPFFEFVFGSSWVMYLWLCYLDFRQHQKLKQKERPANIVDIVDEDKFGKAQAYGLDKSNFAFIKNFVSQIESSAILLLGGYPYVWAKAVKIAGDLGYSEEHEIKVSLVFLSLFGLYSTLTTLPFSLYSTFVVEQKHGFNKQTLGLFFTDLIKSMVIGVLIGFPFISLFIWLVKWGGEHFYVYVWALFFSFQMIMITIYPVFIQPCFNKVDPLPEGKLRSSIEALAKQIDFPLRQLYQIDGSKRSGHSNAYFYGFCKNKRIVLYDTLIDQSTEEEVVAVLGHELGHWQMNHMPKMITIVQIRLFLQFFLFGQVINNPAMYVAFGMTTQPVIIGFFFFNLLLGPVDFVLGFFDVVLTRIHEFQADKYAVGLGKANDLKSGLIKLQIENLGNMNPDKWYSTWHYSHPPLVERLNAIDDVSKKAT